MYFYLVQSDIVGINDIFRDLATLVNEQGEVIGKIENSWSSKLHTSIYYSYTCKCLACCAFVFFRQHRVECGDGCSESGVRK